MLSYYRFIVRVTSPHNVQRVLDVHRRRRHHHHHRRGYELKQLDGILANKSQKITLPS